MDWGEIAIVGSVLVTLIAAAIAWGKLFQKVKYHHDILKKCNSENLVTEDDCSKNMKANATQLEAIKSEIKVDQSKLERYMINTAKSLGRIEGILSRVDSMGGNFVRGNDNEKGPCS